MLSVKAIHRKFMVAQVLAGATARGYCAPPYAASIRDEKTEAAAEDWERECIDATLNGDRDAFNRIVEAYAPRIYTHLYRMLRNREEAEDITQETFIRAYRYLKSYDTARPFRGWIYTVATRLAFNAIRGRKRREATQEKSEHDPTVAAPVAVAPIAPAASAARGELRESLAEAVQQLPEAARILIHLHYQEGMAIREAAEIAGMSEGAARVALHRARKTLREMLPRELGR